MTLDWKIVIDCADPHAQEIKEPGTGHVVMADPEGNESCVQ